MTDAPPPMTPPDRARDRLVLLILALVLGLYVGLRYEPNTFVIRDASFYSTIARGIATDFSLDQRRWQPESWYTGKHPRYRNMDMAWSNVSVGADGTWYPKHSYLMPAFAAPFYALFGTFGLLLFNALCVLAMLYAGYLIARRWASPVASVAAVLLIATSPELLHNTYNVSLDSFGAMLIGTGVAALLSKRLALGGVLLGLAIWSRPPLLILVAPVVLVIAWKTWERRDYLRFVIAISVPLGLAALANTLMFGAPWVTSYDRVLTVVNGEPTIQTARTLFDLGFEDGLNRVFTSGENGILHHAPVGLVAWAGLLLLWRRSLRLCLGLAVAMIGMLVVYIPYRYFDARMFLPWLVLLALPLATTLDDAKHALSVLAERLARASRRTLAIVAGSAVGLLAVMAIASATSGGYQLSDHVLDAQVTRGTMACDYFNMANERWECSGGDAHGWEMTGRALDQCKFEGGEQLGLWIHPPQHRVVKRAVFPNVPGGALVFRYGLASSATAVRTCLKVSRGGPAQELCATKPGVIESVELPAVGAEPGSLTLEIQGPPRGRAHLCADAKVVAAP